MAHREFGFVDDEDSMEYFERKGYKRPPPEAPPTGTPTEIKLTTIDRKLSRITSLLETLVEASRKELIRIPYDSGEVTLPNIIAAVPDVDNTNPVTGYTRVSIWDSTTPNRLAPKLYFINTGPGTIFVRVSKNGRDFSQAESTIFRGDYKVFNNVYELRIRTDTADTRYIATENEQYPGLIVQAVDQKDRNPTIITRRFVNQTLAPHGEIIRLVYTVPTGRKAIIANVHAFVRVTGAQAPPGLKATKIFATVAGVRAFLAVAFMGENENTVGMNDNRNITDAGFLLEGQTVTIATELGGTAGTMGAESSFIIIEVDL